MSPGFTLQQMRKAAGLSQRTIASRMGVTPSRVSAIERTGPDLQLGTVSAYLKALGVSGPIFVMDGDQKWGISQW
jgi:transcriptional regulator with XRE-family HTH domain